MKGKTQHQEFIVKRPPEQGYAEGKHDPPNKPWRY